MLKKTDNLLDGNYMPNERNRRQSLSDDSRDNRIGIFRSLKKTLNGQASSTFDLTIKDGDADPQIAISDDLMNRIRTHKRSSSSDSSYSDSSYSDTSKDNSHSEKQISSETRDSSSTDSENRIISTKVLIQDGRCFLPYDLKGQLPESLVQRAEKELGETPEVRERALKELRDLIHDEGKSFKTDDDVLIIFLRARKFNVKKAFKMMDNFYSYKELHHAVYPYSKTMAQQEFDLGYFQILPYRDAHGRAILLSKIALYGLERFPLNEGVTLVISVLAKMMEEPANQVAGIVYIADSAHIPLKWIKYLTFQNARFSRFLSIDCFPARYKAAHILNGNFLLKIAFQIAERMFSKKLLSRVFVHGKDLTSLHKHIPPALLPSEYGGTLESWKTTLNVEDYDNVKLLS